MGKKKKEAKIKCSEMVIYKMHKLLGKAENLFQIRNNKFAPESRSCFPHIRHAKNLNIRTNLKGSQLIHKLRRCKLLQ